MIVCALSIRNALGIASSDGTRAMKTLIVLPLISNFASPPGVVGLLVIGSALVIGAVEASAPPHPGTARAAIPASPQAAHLRNSRRSGRSLVDARRDAP